MLLDCAVPTVCVKKANAVTQRVFYPQL